MKSIVGLAAAALLAGLSTPTQAAPARPRDNIPGVGKHVVVKEAHWSAIRQWTVPTTLPDVQIETWRISNNVDYLWWPDPSGVAKIAPFMQQTCYSRVTGRGAWFDWTETKAVYQDNNNTVPTAWLPLKHRTGSNNKCRSVAIPLDDRRWLRMDQDPAWEAQGHLILMYTPDQRWHYRWQARWTRYFHPGDDPDIGGWYWDDTANYPGANH